MDGAPPAAADLRGRRVAVTAATGFIGSYVCHTLVRCGARVVAIGTDVGWRPVVPDLVTRGEAEWRQLDVLSASERELAETFVGTDGVVHLAYAPPPTGADPADHERSHNVEGTRRLLERLPRSVEDVVFASSVQVYGAPARLPIRETDACVPTTPYGVAKLATEQLLSESGTDWGVTTLRLSTVYGPMETVPRAIPNFVRRALAGRAPAIRGDGSELRDYIHAGDVARAVALALARGRTPGAYNLGTGVGTSTAELARRIIELTGAEVEPTFHPIGGPMPNAVCDTTRVAESLAFVPQIELADGLRGEIEWFIAHPALWDTGS